MQDTSLRISDVARLIGRSVYTLRDWEKRGLITPRRDPTSGHRIFTHEDVQRMVLMTTPSWARLEESTQ
jgi:DNA-binding transcriptional MerR regulator